MNGRWLVSERKLSAAYFVRNNYLCLYLSSSETDLLSPLFIPVRCLQEHFYVEMSLISDAYNLNCFTVSLKATIAAGCSVDITDSKL